MDNDDLDRRIAARVQSCRKARGFSLAALAEASGVSKAMLSRVENAQSSATAALLGKVAAGLGVSLSELLVDPAPEPQRLHRRAAQPTWKDPQQGWRRRQVAPFEPGIGVQLVEVELPRRTRVDYPPWQGGGYAERIWLVEGRLRIEWGDERFDLEPGDALDIVVDRALAFHNPGDAACRYLLVIAAR
jgi:transcriptional regulator with XRE-family HTH domain